MAGIHEQALQGDAAHDRERDSGRPPASQQERQCHRGGGQRREGALRETQLQRARGEQHRDDEPVDGGGRKRRPVLAAQLRHPSRRGCRDPPDAIERTRVVRGTARRLTVAAQDAEDAADVREGVARGRGDGDEDPACRCRIAVAQPVANLARLAGDLLQAAGDRRLEVARDAHALLLRRLARIPVAVAQDAARALDQTLLQLCLAAHPVPHEHRQRDGDQRERNVRHALDRGVEQDARPGHRDDRRTDEGQSVPAGDVAPGAVQRHQQGDERRDDGSGEVAVEDALGEPHRGDHEQHGERTAPPPRQRERDERERDDRHGPAALAPRSREHLGHAHDCQGDGEEGIVPDDRT